MQHLFVNRTSVRVIRSPGYLVYLMALILAVGIALTAGAIWLLLHGQQFIQNQLQVTPRDMLVIGMALCIPCGAIGFLDAKYTRIILEPGQLTRETCFSFHQIPLPDVTWLLWDVTKPQPRIILETERERIKLELIKLPLNAQRHLILFLRRSIPLSRQSGWEQFGFNGARGILQKHKLPPAVQKLKMAQGFQYITRSDLKALWIEVSLLCLGLAGFFAQLLNDFRLMIFAVAPTILILPIRQCVPRYAFEYPLMISLRSCLWILRVSFISIALTVAFVLDVVKNPGRWPLFVQNHSVLIFCLIASVYLIPFALCGWYIFRNRKNRLAQADQRKHINQSEWRRLEQKFRIRDADLATVER